MVQSSFFRLLATVPSTEGGALPGPPPRPEISNADFSRFQKPWRDSVFTMNLQHSATISGRPAHTPDIGRAGRVEEPPRAAHCPLPLEADLQSPTRDRQSPRRDRPGFALVVTVALLVLLALVAVGLLTLSAITLRAGGQGAAQAEARANARLALLLAIGELQRELGPDQRISANASILADPESDSASTLPHPQWLGVWDSFAGDNRYIDGKHEPDDLVPDLSEHRRESFRRWIVSPAATGEGGADPLDDLDFARAAAGDHLVELLGEGTSRGPAADRRRVRAPLVSLRNAADRPAGSLAFWVGDESQKACLRPGKDEDELDDPLGLLAEIDAPSTIAADLF